MFQAEAISSEALSRLKELRRNPESNIIRFPLVFERLCSTLHITKIQCWSLLFDLREEGIIEIIRYQGIRIL